MSAPLDGEIDVAGVSMMLSRLPFHSGGRSRSDRDAALLLLLHEIHGRGAVVHLAHLVALPV